MVTTSKDAAGEVVNRVSNAIKGARDGYSPPAQATLDKYGDWIVSTLTMRRDPIIPFDCVLNQFWWVQSQSKPCIIIIPSRGHCSRCRQSLPQLRPVRDVFAELPAATKAEILLHL